MVILSTFENKKTIKIVSLYTSEKEIIKKTFFLSTFIDYYKMTWKNVKKNKNIFGKMCKTML